MARETITDEKKEKRASVLSEGFLSAIHGLAFIRQRKDARKARSSLSLPLCDHRSVITKKGNLVVGCKSGRMAVSYDTCSNLVAKHALHRVLPEYCSTHRPRFLYYPCPG